MSVLSLHFKKFLQKSTNKCILIRNQLVAISYILMQYNLKKRNHIINICLQQRTSNLIPEVFAPKIINFPLFVLYLLYSKTFTLYILYQLKCKFSLAQCHVKRPIKKPFLISQLDILSCIKNLTQRVKMTPILLFSK